MSFPRPNARWLWLAAMTASLLPAQALPEGAGKDTVQKACSTCHPAAIVVGRNMSRAQWTAEVSKMVQEGAKLTDAEFTVVVDYLAKSFPQGGAAAAAAPAGGRGRGRGGLNAGPL